jgi:hypothetical protein
MISIDKELVAILAIIFGVLIILVPEIIGYLIGGYLVIFGILTLLGKRV